MDAGDPNADAWAAICGFRERGVQFEEGDGGLISFYVDSQGHRTPMTDGGKADGGCVGWCSPHGKVSALQRATGDGSFEGNDIVVDGTNVVWTVSPREKWYPGVPDSPGPSVWVLPKKGDNRRRDGDAAGSCG
jgi:hypothetical protein